MTIIKYLPNAKREPISTQGKSIHPFPIPGVLQPIPADFGRQEAEYILELVTSQSQSIRENPERLTASQSRPPTLPSFSL